MSSSTTHHSTTSLPPISMFTSRSPTALMPASPPSSGYDKHSSILPKPINSEFYNQKDRSELLSPPQNYYNHNTPTRATSSSSSSSSTPHTPYSSSTSTSTDQSTLWALFNQFQQQQQMKNDYPNKHQNEDRRASDPSSQDGRGLSSEEVLAEKRRRNAGASARFRDRRKQRERELQDKCNELEQRSKEFENALRRVEPDHPLLSKQPDYHRSNTASPPPSSSHPHHHHEDNSTLFDRVGQLEHLMTRFRQEKETDVQKLDELEKENKYLKSLLVPVTLPVNDRRHVENNLNKRIRLSRESSDIEN